MKMTDCTEWRYLTDVLNCQRRKGGRKSRSSSRRRRWWWKTSKMKLGWMCRGGVEEGRGCGVDLHLLLKIQGLPCCTGTYIHEALYAQLHQHGRETIPIATKRLMNAIVMLFHFCHDEYSTYLKSKRILGGRNGAKGRKFNRLLCSLIH